MKKVVAAGTFDVLHLGHIDYLKQAKQEGNHLTIIIARDKTVKKERNQPPKHNEQERLQSVKESGIADEVILGNEEDKLKTIENIKPDIICLGYDQKVDEAKLKEQLAKRGLTNIQLKRMKPFHEDKYKSSLLKGR
jgi:FAD synthetase